MHDSPPQANPLLQYLAIMAGRRNLVIGIVLLTMVITAVYSLVMDKTYQSSATIMPPATSGNSLLGMFGDLPMGDLLGGMGSSGDGAYFSTILNSRMVREELIERFGLREHYEVEDAKIEDILKKVGKKCSATFNMETGMIELAVKDKDPALAHQMAEWMIQRLEEINRDLQTRNASNRRVFLGGEVLRVRSELDSLEGLMLGFQESEKMLEPETQARVLLEEYAALKSQEAVKELELRLARQNFGPSHPEVQQLSQELGELKALRHEAYESGDSELFLAIRQLPAATLEFMRHQRELEIGNKKLIFLLPQLEQAKIDEVNDMPVLKLLDPPRQAEKRIKPKRTAMVLLSAIVSWIVASVLVLFLYRMDTDPELRAGLKSISDNFHGDRS